MTVTCGSNTPTNCYCKTSPGQGASSQYSNVCCSNRGIAETWKFTSNGIPDFNIQAYPPQKQAFVAASWSVDIPTCPYKYINLDTLTYQNTSNTSLMGYSPIAYYISGTPHYPAYDASGAKIESSGERFDACFGHPDFSYKYHHHYGPICVFGNASDTKDCRYYDSANGYSTINSCTPYGWPSTW